MHRPYEPTEFLGGAGLPVGVERELEATLAPEELKKAVPVGGKSGS